MAYNLPPGCSVNDIPGNRPEYEAFDHFCETHERELVDLTEQQITDRFEDWYASLGNDFLYGV